MFTALLSCARGLENSFQHMLLRGNSIAKPGCGPLCHVESGEGAWWLKGLGKANEVGEPSGNRGQRTP